MGLVAHERKDRGLHQEKNRHTHSDTHAYIRVHPEAAGETGGRASGRVTLCDRCRDANPNGRTDDVPPAPAVLTLILLVGVECSVFGSEDIVPRRRHNRVMRWGRMRVSEEDFWT